MLSNTGIIKHLRKKIEDLVVFHLKPFITKMKENVICEMMAKYLMEKYGIYLHSIHLSVDKKFNRDRRKSLSGWIDSFYWGDCPLIGYKSCKELYYLYGNEFNSHASSFTSKLSYDNRQKGLIPRGIPLETFYY